jgi:ABC-2 type transport system ATP-binding protein
VDVIEIKSLRKVYRRFRGGSTVALDGLDLIVPQGGVFGFLGPNGSGKTTTIRCLLGLAHSSGGSCTVLGKDPNRGLQEVIPRIGALVEAPAMFPNFSGRRNLEILATVGRLPSKRVDEVLEQVDLTARAKDRVKTYSLGMRQRLGLAAALLRDPELLILDEPANGLDPAGIREVRELLRRLAAEGRTVLVSSHILSEIQQTCDRVAILQRGRCIAQGDVDDVLSRGRKSGLLMRITEPARAIDTLQSHGVSAVEVDGLLEIEHASDRGREVVQMLASAGLYPDEIRPHQVDLETVFLQLTGDGAKDEGLLPPQGADPIDPSPEVSS